MSITEVSPGVRLLSREELKTEKGIKFSRVHLFRLVRDKKFPAPVHLGAQTLAWVETEIDAWIKVKISEREAA
jgi:prophage regulatory protein